MDAHQFPSPPERHTMPEQTPAPGRIIGYECTNHGFFTKSVAALQLHVATLTNCNPGPVREGSAPEHQRAPEHQCEPWQQGLGAQGPYCIACGKPSLPPKPEPAEPPHDGPHWRHDCDACIYLGSLPHYDKQYDLYWCPPNKFMEEGNLVARHGTMGDYVSGMSWLLREPILATAAIFAMREGHLAASVLRDRPMH